jgi:hypothetical protein
MCWQCPWISGSWATFVFLSLKLLFSKWCYRYCALKFEQVPSEEDYKIGICWFSAKHAALRRKSKDWLARNQNNVSEWSDMSTRGLLFQWSSTIKIQLSVLVKYKADLIIISLKINLYSPWYSWKIVELAFKQQSLTHSLTLKKTPEIERENH